MNYRFDAIATASHTERKAALVLVQSNYSCKRIVSKPLIAPVASAGSPAAVTLYIHQHSQLIRAFLSMAGKHMHT